jgi:hypothetical protein
MGHVIKDLNLGRLTPWKELKTNLSSTDEDEPATCLPKTSAQSIETIFLMENSNRVAHYASKRLSNSISLNANENVRKLEFSDELFHR